MKSNEVKYSILRWMKFNKQLMCMATEYKNGSDVFGVNRSGYSTEVEVKVNWADFMSEINTINYILHGTNGFNGKRLNKYYKHQGYLQNKQEFKCLKIPRYFYFAVTEDLGERALKKLESIPYGLLVVKWLKPTKYYKGRFIVLEIKKAEKIGKTKFTDWESFCRKVSNENFGLQTKIISSYSNNLGEKNL